MCRHINLRRLTKFQNSKYVPLLRIREWVNLLNPKQQSGQDEAVDNEEPTRKTQFERCTVPIWDLHVHNRGHEKTRIEEDLSDLQQLRIDNSTCQWKLEIYTRRQKDYIWHRQKENQNRTFWRRSTSWKGLRTSLKSRHKGDEEQGPPSLHSDKRDPCHESSL